MKKYVTLFTLLIVGLGLVQPVSNLAQSGRRRPSERSRRSTESEGPPAEKSTEPAVEKIKTPIPPGGEIEERALDPKVATLRFQLKNGLTVLVREKYSKPMVAMTVYVKVGRMDESEGSWGVAELIQRLLWQGTTTRSKTRAARELRQLGGVIEAQTLYEQTTYQVVVPAEEALEALDILADVLEHPLFEEETIRRQAELMCQEYESQHTDLSARAFQSMLGVAFPRHFLGRPLSFEGLRTITRDQVVKFYNTHYRPEKVILSIVGAISPFAVTEPIQRGYGDWSVLASDTGKSETENPKSEITDQEPKPEQEKTEPPVRQLSDQQPMTRDERPATSDQLRYGRLEAEIDPTLLIVSFRLDGIEKADRSALEVLSAVLSRGQASRIEQELRGTRPVVWDYSVNRLSVSPSELWSFQFWVAPEHFNTAEIGFFEVVQRLRREVLSPGELQRAQSLLERRFYDQRARVQNEATLLAKVEATVGDYHEADRYLEQIRAVTATQVQRVAAKFLTLSKATVYEAIPRRLAAPGVTGESFAKWIGTQVPGIDNSVAANQVTQASPVPLIPQGHRERPAEEVDAVIFSLQPEPVRDFSVLRGSRAYVRVDRGRPTVSVGLFFQGGRLFEDTSNNGITELMLRAMLRGAKSKWNPETGAVLDRDEEESLSAGTIAMRLEQLGAEIQLVNEPDFFGFILNVLSRNQDRALKMLVDVIERPTFDEAEVVRVRNALLYELRRQQAEPIELAWQALVGTHPYGLSRLGTPPSLQNLMPEQLRAWRDRTIGRMFPLAVIVGDTDGSILISTIIAREFRRRETDQTFRAQIPTVPEQPREQAKLEGNRSALAVGFLQPQSKDNGHEIFGVIEHLLSGRGGRLTDQLRDESGLVYQVRATYESRFLASAFFVTVAFLPENEARIREALEHEFNRLASEPVEDEELALGVNSTIGAQSIDLESHLDRAVAYARRVFLNGEPSEVETYADRIRALTKEKIRAVASQYLKWNQRGIGMLRAR